MRVVHLSMRIALYGGSFDPIHHGHLILAREALERLELDRVFFIPAAISPHKPGRPPASAILRAEMVAAAIAHEPGFEMDQCELFKEGPSYSIETAENFRARWPEAELFYLIGYDHLEKLHTWRRIDDLRRIARFAVFDRGHSDCVHGMPTLSRRLDISATEIRERVARGASIRYLVPESVRLIIERHQLYKETTH
ncbi:MAG: nicotinate-nucleotide adenylyltransferase [Chthoniobacteraceae bacterium]|nr:nicotinate-nucleotide adenylyltransferase [Chthoniobacteraceae bacterium]MDB6172334.1 nicotinate-nucleotide adenylyltransferase [Chthoniobacteraceae bacterium]